jgi:hypothetical protein
MNKLYRISKEEFEKKRILYKFNDVKYVILDGAGITTYEEYFDKLWEAFGFSDIPEGWKKDYYTEDDFMTEMDELPNDKYIFVIKNYESFLINDYSIRERIENHYENYLLPFWDEEVERVVVEGKRKDFNIYLVSNE